MKPSKLSLLFLYILSFLSSYSWLPGISIEYARRYIYYSLFALFLFLAFVNHHIEKRLTLNVETKRFLGLILLLYISCIPGLIKADWSPGVFANIFFPALIIIGLSFCQISREQLMLTLKIYTAGVFLQALYVISTSLGIVPFFSNPTEAPYPDSIIPLLGFTTNIIALSVQLAFASMLALAFVFERRKDNLWRNLWIIVFFVLCITELYAVFFIKHGRSGLLALLVCLFVFSVKFFKSKKIRQTVIAMACIAVILFGAQILQRLNVESVTVEGIFSSRIYAWLISKDILLDNIVTGVGFGQFHKYYPAYEHNYPCFMTQVPNAAVNLVLNMGVSSGIVAGLIVLVFWVKSLLICVKGMKSGYKMISHTNVIAIAPVSILVVSLFESGAPFQMFSFLAWWICMYFLLAYGERGQMSKEREYQNVIQY